MAKNTSAPDQSPLQHARTVLGQNPRDVATHLKIGSDLFDQLESVFNSIEILNEKPGIYAGKAEIEMTGEWQAQISYEGPAGKGKFAIPVSAQ